MTAIAQGGIWLIERAGKGKGNVSAMIRFVEVSKSFEGASAPAVLGMSLRVEPGEFLILLGESGSGKTTTLKMINRLIEHDEGTIEVDGQDVNRVDPVALRRQIGYVVQGVGLLPHLSVGENVAIVPRLLGWKPGDVDRRVLELLEVVNLPPEQYQHRFPEALSGGQQQRVGVARALAGRPRIMLLDEPFGALDPINRDRLQEEYRRLHQSLGLTTVMVTHDMTEALVLADRIAVLKAGRLVRLGTPRELLADPGEDYVAHLIETPRRQADRLGGLFEATRGQP
ncbi:ABC transporter ATP-binding protein [soil metagenome]